LHRRRHPVCPLGSGDAARAYPIPNPPNASARSLLWPRNVFPVCCARRCVPGRPVPHHSPHVHFSTVIDPSALPPFVHQVFKFIGGNPWCNPPVQPAKKHWCFFSVGTSNRTSPTSLLCHKFPPFILWYPLRLFIPPSLMLAPPTGRVQRWLHIFLMGEPSFLHCFFR